MTGDRPDREGNRTPAAGQRVETIRLLVREIMAVAARSGAKVAIDGVDGAGKTRFADDAALRRLVLDPLGPHGDRRIVRAIYDVHREAPVSPEMELVPDGAVLVLDGIFLHRPELRSCWDYSVFLDVRFDVSIPRGAQRGYGDPDPSAESNRRYIEGQKIYLETCRPQQHATVVVDNDDLTRPVIVKRRADPTGPPMVGDH